MITYPRFCGSLVHKKDLATDVVEVWPALVKIEEDSKTTFLISKIFEYANIDDKSRSFLCIKASFPKE